MSVPIAAFQCVLCHAHVLWHKGQPARWGIVDAHFKYVGDGDVCPECDNEHAREAGFSNVSDRRGLRKRIKERTA